MKRNLMTLALATLGILGAFTSNAAATDGVTCSPGKIRVQVFPEGHNFPNRVSWLVLVNPLDHPITVRYRSQALEPRHDWFGTALAPQERKAIPIFALMFDQGGFSLDVSLSDPDDVVVATLVSWDVTGGVYSAPMETTSRTLCIPGV